METTMTQTEKEQYELTIKNMQSKIDWLRDQRKLMDTYGKKYEPLTDKQRREIIELNTVEGYHGDYYLAFDIIDDVEAAHGIRPTDFKEQPKKPEYSDPCPDCGKQLFVAAGGGVKCTCGYWFCF
jgi:hypothetical protein